MNSETSQLAGKTYEDSDRTVGIAVGTQCRMNSTKVQNPRRYGGAHSA